MILQTWGDVFTSSFQNLSAGVVDFLPRLLFAILIFVLGWVVGAVLGRIVAQVIRTLKIDAVLRNAGVEDFLRKAGFTLDSGHFVGSLIKWFVVVVFLIATFDLLGLKDVNTFLREVVLLYIPRLIVAVFVLLAAAVIGEALKNVVTGAAKTAGVKTSNLLGSITRWAIWIFAILTALFQLGVAAPLVQTLFTGLVIAISLAVGLSFGLGGQKAAADYIETLKKELSHHNDQGPV